MEIGTIFYAAKKFDIKFNNGYPQVLGTTRSGLTIREFKKVSNYEFEDNHVD